MFEQKPKSIQSDSRECWNCEETVVADRAGSCPVCGQQLVQPAVEMFFFCEQCKTEFESRCDDSGNQQANCPACGAIAYSDSFLMEMKIKEQQETNYALRRFLVVVFIGLIAISAFISRFF